MPVGDLLRPVERASDGTKDLEANSAGPLAIGGRTSLSISGNQRLTQWADLLARQRRRISFDTGWVMKELCHEFGRAIPKAPRPILFFLVVVVFLGSLLIGVGGLIVAFRSSAEKVEKP